MLRFSFKQVQDYAHSAGLYIAKFQSASGTSFRFKVFDVPDKDYLDEDSLFETTSLAEIVAFVRGYRKAIARFIRETKGEIQGKPEKPATEPVKKPKRTMRTMPLNKSKEHAATAV